MSANAEPTAPPPGSSSPCHAKVGKRKAQSAAAQAMPSAQPSDPTNTGVNTRDRDPNAVTPMDQSNQSADITVTRSIRDAITTYGMHSCPTGTAVREATAG